MVDTSKGNNDEEREDATKDRSFEKQSKRRRKRRSKPRLDRDSGHTDPATEQGEPANDEHGIQQPSEQGNLDKQTEQPVPGEVNSPDDLTPDKLLE